MFGVYPFGAPYFADAPPPARATMAAAAIGYSAGRFRISSSTDIGAVSYSYIIGTGSLSAVPTPGGAIVIHLISPRQPRYRSIDFLTAPFYLRESGAGKPRTRQP